MKIKSYLFTCISGICFASSLVFAGSSLDSDLNTQLQKSVDEYMAQYAQQEQFTAIAASVLIPRDKRIDVHDIKNFVAGTMGKLPFTQAITAHDLFDIGSITKSFTAVLLLQLHTTGILSLDDSLGKWLPQYKQWSKVSLRQLLNMTSGIPNYSADSAFEKKAEANLAYNWTNEELLTYAHPEKPIKVDPEHLFSYSNSNYILAAMVIEQATKDTFAHQVEKIIKQNDLNNTYYPAGADGISVAKEISSRKIHGYFYNKETDQTLDTFNNDLSWAGAAGALVANTEDVARWVQLLYHGTLIDARYREQALLEMETLVSLKTGKPIAKVSEKEPGGFGLGIASYYDKESKQAFWVYQGSTLGFRVMYFWNPCNGVTTVVALNSKAGEGDPDSKLGNHIIEANLNLYKIILQHHNELSCTL